MILNLAYSRKHKYLGGVLLSLIHYFLRNPERKLNYTNQLIMLNLHKRNFEKARKLEQIIKTDPRLKSIQLYVLGDFLPSEISYSSNYLKILSDARVSTLSAYLISRLEKAEEWVTLNFPGFEAGLTYFFMNGTGPSPFNAQLGDIYLKVGHYNPVAHDREIVQHAIIHELTHIHLRNHIGFWIGQSDFGIRKFFDEGFAQYCGFQSVGAYSRKLIHAHACSAVVIKKDLNGLLKRIDKWQNTLFNERHYPLYQASLSFISYMEERIGFDGLIELFKEAGRESNFSSLIRNKTGVSFKNLLSNWISQLPDSPVIVNQEFCEITVAGRFSTNELKLSYKSRFPLYPVRDILVLNSAGTQLGISIERSKRYEKSGEFIVLCEQGETLSLTIVHDENVQQTEIRKSV